MAAASPPDVIFEGDSRAIIRSFPKQVRENFGGELQRVQNNEHPLDSSPMAPVLRGVFELRDEDKDFWYRVLYFKTEGVVHVLHCFKKKTNKTSQNDVKIARDRLRDLKARLASPKK